MLLINKIDLVLAGQVLVNSNTRVFNRESKSFRLFIYE